MEPYRSKHCLCIGIDGYCKLEKLNNAVNDAREVGRLLDELYGFDSHCLTDAEGPTLRRISEAIQDELRARVGPDDLVVVFFAGHGHTERFDGEAEGFIAPIDAVPGKTSALISMNQLVTWSGRLSRHVLYIFDACFSGILARLAGTGRIADDSSKQRARIVITAGDADQPVGDGSGSGNGHSPFTAALLDGLERGLDQPDYFTATELYSFLSRRFKDRALAQEPKHGMLKNHEGGEIILRRTS